MTSRDDYFLPLNDIISLYSIEELRKVADRVHLFLRMKNRTDKQIKYVQDLIYQLIEIYFEQEQDKEISELKENLLDHICYSSDPHPDQHLFEFDYCKDGLALYFIGCTSDLDAPNEENMDPIDALGEIVHWLKDDETEDGFIDAEPCEYFYALSLSLINDAVSLIKLIGKEPAGKGNISLDVSHPITEAAMKAYKAMCYGDKIKTEAMHESQLNKLYKENSLLKEKIDELSGINKKEAIKKVEMLKKATDSRHKKNRAAKMLVCQDWFEKKSIYKTAMEAAGYYKTWLESKSYVYELITIRNWILLYAKEKGVRW